MPDKITQIQVTPNQLSELAHTIARSEPLNDIPSAPAKTDGPLQKDVIGPRTSRLDLGIKRVRHRRPLPARSTFPPHCSRSTKPLQEGIIAIASIQQSDRSRKPRPVLLLRQMPGYGDFLVCGISTKVGQAIPGFDEVLMPDADNQLQATSVVRLSTLVSLSVGDIDRVVGFISAVLHMDLLNRLAGHLIEHS